MTHILLIEDDPQYRKLLVRILTDDGFQVESAENGKAGLQLFLAHPADLVITDLFMPEMDGIEIIRYLSKVRPRPKVLALSGGYNNYPACYNLSAAKIMGASHTLVKPFTLKAFKSTLSQVLN